MYDLIVVGGGTSGCATAYTAGKKGLKVLLIEKNTYLGGSMTGGLVIPMMLNNAKRENLSFYENLLSCSKKFAASVTYCDGNDGWFNPELLKCALDDMMSDANVKVYFDTQLFSACTENNVKNDKENDFIKEEKTISSILCIHRGLSLSFESKYFVDATGDGNLSILCGCQNLTKNDEKQQTSLRFILGNVNKRKFADWILNLDKDRNVTSVCEAENDVHFSTAYTWDTNKDWALKPFFEEGIDKGIISEEDSSYFQIFSVANMPGAVAFNCPRLFNDDDLTPVNTSKCLQEGRKRILRISAFVKKYFPGFENAAIINIADLLGVRASRRIECEQIKTVNAISDSVNSPILSSDYPIDIHAKDKNSSSLKNMEEPCRLSIENLKAKGIKNLYTVGRCLGADFFCQAALRIQINCMSMGEAAAKEIFKQIKCKKQ